MTLDINNLNPLPITYVDETSNAAPAGTYFYPFDWVDIPNEKFYA